MNVVIHTQFALRPLPFRDGRVPGEEVLMGDGSIWFHPYNGAAPVLVRKPKPTTKH
jgi:hypothetical protein